MKIAILRRGCRAGVARMPAAGTNMRRGEGPGASNHKDNCDVLHYPAVAEHCSSGVSLLKVQDRNLTRHAPIAYLAAAALSVGSASAVPLDFDIDVGGSSVALTTQLNPAPGDLGGGLNAVSCGFTSCAVTESLAPGFATPETFSLAQGETQVIPFITLTTNGIGSLDLDIAATLAFDVPGAATTSSSGSGFAVLVGGLLTAGSLTWDDVPAATTLADGSVVTVDFQDLSGVDFLSKGSVYTVNAYVTATSIAPVPLPAAGLLLIAGLGGLAALARRRASPA